MKDKIMKDLKNELDKYGLCIFPTSETDEEFKARLKKDCFFVFRYEYDITDLKGNIISHLERNKDRLYCEFKLIEKENRIKIPVNDGCIQNLWYRKGKNIFIRIINDEFLLIRETPLNNKINNEGGEDIEVIGIYKEKYAITTEGIIKELEDVGGQFCCNYRAVYLSDN
jgi:hypothetical protein